jgi:hypothetical protein
MELPGTPSDEVQGVLATGRGDFAPLFAGPFHPVVPHEWDRYVP